MASVDPEGSTSAPHSTTKNCRFHQNSRHHQRADFFRAKFARIALPGFIKAASGRDRRLCKHAGQDASSIIKTVHPRHRFQRIHSSPLLRVMTRTDTSPPLAINRESLWVVWSAEITCRSPPHHLRTTIKTRGNPPGLILPFCPPFRLTPLRGKQLASVS